ncbi:MAG: exopolysaccharide biosynthesis polyprenyl glycosylphosphotransferase [Verrucomicrobia bacterium]|nr:MAG: exopolysaccharide biosynthesis polyprenyl glycosylphosphotransferase [Verrucomicrobiota bacterium]
MLRRDRLIRMQVHELMDACLFALSFWLACTLREDPDLSDLLGLTKIGMGEDQYVWLLFLVLIPAAPMVLEAQGFYSRPLSCSRRTTAWVLLKACCIIALALIIATFCFQVQMRRSIIVWFGFVSFGLMFLKEEVLRSVTRSKLAQSQNRRRFILVGTSDETRAMRAELKAKSPEGIEILAELDLSKTPMERLVEMLHDYSVNGVILSAKHTYFDQVEQVIRACELEGVEAWVVADFFRTQISRTSLDDFYGRPVMVFRTAPESSWQGLFKQLLDFFGALILLALGALPMLVFAILVKRSSPGPVFFRQQRSGLNGRPFTILKFRTMVTNAEQLKHELAAMNEMSGPVFKVTNDPRVTRIGRWLRKSSLDELPQLFNVLRGEMSLVGPRPLPVDEVKRFNDLAHRRRLSVKPGLTCLWQISGRNNVSNFDEWVQLDLKYIDTWSLWLDLKILARTVPVVLAGTGAK